MSNNPFPEKHHYQEPSSIFSRKSTLSPCEFPKRSYSKESYSEKYAEKYDNPTSVYSNNNLTTVSSGTNAATTPRGKVQAKLRSCKSLGSLAGNQGQKVLESNGQTLLSDHEILQIELSYKAHKSFVYVSRCLANLYHTKTDLINGGRISSPRSHEWKLARTGVPVIVFDKGETRAREKRQLQVILAERGTGFTLWADVIDNLSDYKAIHQNFHTLYLSCDHRKMAGLSFDSSEAASDFLRNIEAITCDPLNIALSVPKKHKEKGRGLKVKLSKHLSLPKLSLPKKSDISSPCLFQHITSVDISDFDRLFSVSTLMEPCPSPVYATLPHTLHTPLRRLQSTAVSALNISTPSSSSPSPAPCSSSSSSENSSNFSYKL